MKLLCFMELPVYCYQNFKRQLAESIGIGLDSVQNGELIKSGDSIKDSILLFFKKSVLNEDLMPEECKQISDALKEISRTWENEFLKLNACTLAEVMENATTTNRALEVYPIDGKMRMQVKGSIRGESSYQISASDMQRVLDKTKAISNKE